MIRSLLLAACFCALALSCAEARPARSVVPVTGWSQPDMRPCEGGRAIPRQSNVLGRISKSAKGGEIPPLNVAARVPAHGAVGGSRAISDSTTGGYGGRWRGVTSAGLLMVRPSVPSSSGRRGRGHVGIITGKTARGWVVLSGNDGNAVRERVRSVSNAIAFRWP